MRRFVALTILMCAGHAHAINKCTDAAGSVVYQDAPCPGKGVAITAKPASGPAVAGPASAVEGSLPKRPLSEAQRIEADVAKSQRERRIRELQEHAIPRAEGAISSHAIACNEQQARYEQMKFRYVQNLYGKTDAAQTASEQAAAAARCDTKDRELREAADRTRKECVALGGCL